MTKQRETADRKAVSPRRARPGGLTKKSVTSRLQSLGVDENAIPALLRETAHYAKLVRLGEPTSTATILKSLKEIRLDSINYLQMIDDQPREAILAIFDLGNRGVTPDEEFQSFRDSLHKLIANAKTLAEFMPPPQTHSHKEFWPRNWIARVANVLRSSGWEFAETNWGDAKSPSDYRRLANVIAVLNDGIPEYAQVSVPKNLVREIFDIT